MFTVCVGLVFRSKYVQFAIICSLQYSMNINTVEVVPHSDLLQHICIVKLKNSDGSFSYAYKPLSVLTATTPPFKVFIACIGATFALLMLPKFPSPNCLSILSQSRGNSQNMSLERLTP